MSEEGNCIEYRELQKTPNQTEEDAKGVNTCEAEEQTQVLTVKDERIESTFKEEEQILQVNVIKNAFRLHREDPEHSRAVTLIE